MRSKRNADDSRTWHASMLCVINLTIVIEYYMLVYLTKVDSCYLELRCTLQSGGATLDITPME